MAALQGSFEAEANLWNYLLRFVSSMALKCAVDLRIPDAIHKHGGRPVLLSQLVADLGISPNKATRLRRLMLTLTNYGLFKLTMQDGNGAINGGHDGEGEAYLLTDSSRLLVADNTHSMADFLRWAFDPWLMMPWLSLSAWFQDPADSPSLFYFHNGMSFWEATNKSSKMNTMFNDAMTSATHLTIDSTIKRHGETLFKGLTSLIDVGGESGAAAIAITREFPHIKCIVLDLPQVISTVQKNGPKHVDFVAGDMFRSIPPADAILLKWILHNWGDEDCVKLLKLCKEAIPPRKDGGKVIILDMVMHGDDLPGELEGTQRCFDLVMMAQFNGKERNETEWQKLFSDAGFSGYKILSWLGMSGTIEVYY